MASRGEEGLITGLMRGRGIDYWPHEGKRDVLYEDIS